MNQILGGAAVLGLMAGFWEKIKFLLSRMSTYFIVNIRIDGSLTAGFMIMAQREFKRSPYGEQYYSSGFRWVKPHHDYKEVAFERFNSDQPIIFWRGWRPLMIQVDKSGNQERNNDVTALNIFFIRNTWDKDVLVAKAMEHYNNTANASMATLSNSMRRFFTHKFVGSGNKDKTSLSVNIAFSAVGNTMLFDASVRFVSEKREDIGMSQLEHESAISKVAVPQHIKDLITEIKQWRQNGQWYKDRGIQWRKGWGIYGKPGNGKTTLACAIGKDLDMPIFSYDLGSMSNAEMNKAWQEMLRYTPCIALIEDIDNVFHRRENIVKDGGGITFDCLLNCINGVEESNGIFTMSLRAGSPYGEAVDPMW